MRQVSERFVPKVHPATRFVEPEDPMTLNATAVAGDPEVLLRCLVQEYAWMGWDGDQIFALFQDPFYPALHDLLSAYGETAIRGRISAVLGRGGVFRIRAIERDDSIPADDAIRTGCSSCPSALLSQSEPEVVEIGIPARFKPTTRTVADALAAQSAIATEGSGGASHA